MSDQTPQPSLQSLARYLGWGDNMSDDAIFSFVAQRESILRVAQELLETNKSDAPTAEDAIRDRVATLTARCEALEQALEDVDAFLKHIEWNDTTSEHDAENLRHQIEVARSIPR